MANLCNHACSTAADQQTAPANDFWLAIHRHAIQSPDAPAILSSTHLSLSPETLSYGELWLRILNIGAQLRNAHIGRDDRIALLLPNGPEALVLLLGILRNAICVPLNPNLTDAELKTHLDRIRPAAVVMATQQGHRDRSALTQLGISTFTWDGQELRSICANLSRSTTIVDGGEQPVLLMFTSATSGRAKVVPHTTKSLSAIFAATRDALTLHPNDRLLLLSPLFHSLGIISALAQLTSGGSVFVASGFDASCFESSLTTLKPTWLTCGPTTHRAILTHLKSHPLQTRTTLRFTRSSGAPLAPELIRGLTHALNAPLLDAYGLSETGAIATMTPELFCELSNIDTDAPFQQGLVGRSIGPEIAILSTTVSSEAFRMQPGVDGEIVVRGPAILAGYLDDPEANAESFRDGWFRTGDFGHLDQNGCLFITGRLKEIINRGGQKIIPVEVEAVLNQHPDVAESAVFAVPHPTLGEEVACGVVLHASAEPIHPELLSNLREFAAYKPELL